MNQINLQELEDDFDDNADRLFSNRQTSKSVSRARTKNRPVHFDLISGTVFNTERGRYLVRINKKDDEIKMGANNFIVCARARELRDNDIVPGDLVEIKPPKNFDFETEQSSENAILENCVGRIVSINPRNSQLIRTADDSKKQIRTIAANADQCLIISSTISPSPQFDFLSRCFVSAVEGGMNPIFYLSKLDLNPEFDETSLIATLKEKANNLSDSALKSELNSQIENVKIVKDTNSLKNFLKNKTTVFVGLSGVGKSTLINNLCENANRKVGEVSANGDGRHTSTSSFAFTIDENSIIIDTPGIRSFGLGHML